MKSSLKQQPRKREGAGAVNPRYCGKSSMPHDEETDLRITMKLRGIFSFFPIRYLTQDEILNSENHESHEVVYSYSLETCHCEVWGISPLSFVSCHCGWIWITCRCMHILRIFVFERGRWWIWYPCLILEDKIRCTISSCNATTDPDLAQEAALLERLEFSKLAISMGSTAVADSSCELFEATVTAEVNDKYDRYGTR